MTYQEGKTLLYRYRLQPGETIYLILRHRSRNGEARWVDFYIMRHNTPIWITSPVCAFMAFPFSEKYEAINLKRWTIDSILKALSENYWILHKDKKLRGSKPFRWEWL